MFNSISLFKVAYFISVFITCTVYSADVKSCERYGVSTENGTECGIQQRYSKKRYVLYDVNPPEGFNLRRDVYIRVAVFIKHLAEQDKQFEWNLVLPPWGNLYHWKQKDKRPETRLPWATFFNVTSLQRYVPVIEMYQFLAEYGSENKTVPLNCVYILKNDEEMFRTGRFRDKNQIVDCEKESLRYKKINDHSYRGFFWGYSNVTAQTVKCVIFHGMMADLRQNLEPERYRSIMFDHMEIPLHDVYGSQDYWLARRSMRYNNKLYRIANEFRQKYLNSTDDADNTHRHSDWTKEKERRNAIGGPYLSVHLRRRDFLIGHIESVPTLKSAASQLKKKLKKLDLKVLFVATDAELHEFNEFKTYLKQYLVIKFSPEHIKEELKDGEIAIIDQIICSHARYFIGTHESTFTFRIQEDREIIGFPSETTFNQLCKTKEKCMKSGQWEIVW